MDHSRSRTRRGKAPARATDFSAEEALRGLPSRLVISLARLAGATLSDLSVTLQLMPFADRAVMKAYGLVTIGPKDRDGNRPLTAEPFCLEVIAAAAELIASVVDPADVAARLLHESASEVLYDEAPYVPSVPENEQLVPGGLTVDAVVKDAVEADGRTQLWLTFVGSAAPDLSGMFVSRASWPADNALLVTTDTNVKLKPHTAVKVAYDLRDVLRSATISIIDQK